MSAGQPLRLYANPIKQVLYLLICAAFVAVGYVLVRVPGSRARVFWPIIGWASIVFFGLGTVVFLITFVVYVLLRRPVLSIDGQSWAIVSGLSPTAQRVEWQQIKRIAVFRQRLQGNGAFSQTQYLLTVFGEADPSRQTLPRLRARLQSRYPMLQGAIGSVTLNTVFFRPTPERCEKLLERIETACAHEIAMYGVQVAHELRDI